MSLERINWTQIDTSNIPSGFTVNLGAIVRPLDGVHTNDLTILGIDFFDYLESMGYTGATPHNVYVADNGGLFIIQESTGKTLSTIYNTSLDPTLSMPTDVGGIPSSTTVSELTGKTLVQLMDDILFPDVSPTYTIPTIVIGNVLSQTLEVGEIYSPSIGAYGVKNDAGAFTRLRVLRNGSPIVTSSTFTITSESDIPNQFGYNNPNNPNYGYSINPSYSEYYVIPLPDGSNTSTSTTYYVDGNYSNGTAKQNNKNITDIRPSLVRSVNAPQSAGVNFSSSISTITGIFPYFYGTSLTIPNVSTISAFIASGTSSKILSLASGTLSIPYNISGQYIWFAYYSNYTTKTKWYVNALDNGDIDGSFISTMALQSINSPESYWSGITFKMHWSVYATIQSTIEFRNS